VDEVVEGRRRRSRGWKAGPGASFKMSRSSVAPVVTLGGQTISMLPMTTFPSYTLYGGDISSFAGQVATLSVTEAAPAHGLPYPSYLFLDDIRFVTIPEPSFSALCVLGSLLIGMRVLGRFKFLLRLGGIQLTRCPMKPPHNGPTFGQATLGQAEMVEQLCARGQSLPIGPLGSIGYLHRGLDRLPLGGSDHANQIAFDDDL